MNNQSANLAKRMQLEESLLSRRQTFKDDVVLYNELSSQIAELNFQRHELGEKINVERGIIKTLEMDIELLNKVNKEIDNALEEQFKLVGE